METLEIYGVFRYMGYSVMWGIPLCGVFPYMEYSLMWGIPSSGKIFVGINVRHRAKMSSFSHTRYANTLLYASTSKYFSICVSRRKGLSLIVVRHQANTLVYASVGGKVCH